MDGAAPPNALLLVEDDVSLAVCVAELLSRRGRDVELAFDLPAASRALARQEWAAVVTDVDLTGTGSTGGLDVVAAAARHSPRPAILVWSGCVTAGLRRKALQLGADVVLEKGSLWELETQLDIQLADRRAHPPFAATGPLPEPLKADTGSAAMTREHAIE
jgi:DNA-binding response OmpR family regulator